jgi:hypothetical protein
MHVSEDEDAQLRLAVEMSLQSASSSRERSPQPQTSQTVEKSPYFGPARRTEYSESSWGMVLSDSSPQETGVVQDQTALWSTSTEGTRISPLERKRVEGSPVVLEASNSHGAWFNEANFTLAGLMTIFHKIPIAREAFILAAPKDPGHQEAPGDTWWQGGHPTSTLESNEIDVTGECILRECARTMAFLDDTERAYGKYMSSTSMLITDFRDILWMLLAMILDLFLLERVQQILISRSLPFFYDGPTSSKPTLNERIIQNLFPLFFFQNYINPRF